MWKLGNFECACRYDNINKKYLSSLKMIRAEECITPEEDEKVCFERLFYLVHTGKHGF